MEVALALGLLSTDRELLQHEMMVRHLSCYVTQEANTWYTQMGIRKPRSAWGVGGEVGGLGQRWWGKRECR